MLIERFQNKSSLGRRRKQFPLAVAHAYSSDGFLLSIQFIGQLGLKRPVLRKFLRASDPLGARVALDGPHSFGKMVTVPAFEA